MFYHNERKILTPTKTILVGVIYLIAILVVWSALIITTVTSFKNAARWYLLGLSCILCSALFASGIVCELEFF